jgi:hypothetical protein
MVVRRIMARWKHEEGFAIPRKMNHLFDFGKNR